MTRLQRSTSIAGVLRETCALHDILGRAEMTSEASIFTAYETKRWPKRLRDRLVKLDILRETGLADSIYYDGCDEGCWINPEWIEYPKVGLRGVYFCRAENCGRIEFDPAERRRWVFHLEGLAMLLAASIGLEGSLEPLTVGRICRLGVLPTGGGPIDVFLARGLRWADAASVVERTERLRTAAGLAVIVLGDAPAPTIWPSPRPTVLSLSELATWSDTEETVDFRALANVLKSLRPPAREEAWLTVTEAAKLVMRDFPHLDLEAAKVRISRAATAGTLVTNGKAGHARRVERTSLDVWRLAQRDRDLAREEVPI